MQIEMASVFSKRTLDDEQLCHRFHKRLRLDDYPSSGYQGYPYEVVNGLLCRLHAEQVSRRKRAGSSSLDDVRGMANLSLDDEEDGGEPPTTQFSIADVVHCSHGPKGRCLRCSGRLVANLPLAAYGAFCHAYGDLSRAAPSSLPPARSQAAAELSFAALASLAAVLAPARGERLLHLGSGSGRTVVAWALLFPHSDACGVEASFVLHRMAAAAAAQFDTPTRKRLFLHHSDPDDVEDWHGASIIFVSAAAFDDRSAAKVAAGIRAAEPGTRVVAFGRPLATVCSPSAMQGLQLAWQAQYRTTSAGNMTTFIYCKLTQAEVCSD